jgi:hypothetical protein
LNNLFNHQRDFAAILRDDVTFCMRSLQIPQLLKRHNSVSPSEFQAELEKVSASDYI